MSSQGAEPCITQRFLASTPWNILQQCLCPFFQQHLCWAFTLCINKQHHYHQCGCSSTQNSRNQSLRFDASVITYMDVAFGSLRQNRHLQSFLQGGRVNLRPCAALHATLTEQREPGGETLLLPFEEESWTQAMRLTHNWPQFSLKGLQLHRSVIFLLACTSERPSTDLFFFL